jgi:nitroimidazol reductase NimA-like FMN-containing flavoprotein (pyridoxamine 5'-phosphate oxidase superfamily)
MASTREPRADQDLRALQTLTVDEIRTLLPLHGVGRVVFVDARGPVALPVNYVLDHDDFVFRTESSSSILSAASAGRVSFEVDQIDEHQRLGWSVLATGTVQRVEEPADLQHVTMLRATPWAKGPRDHHLRLTVRKITGRRLEIDDEPPFDVLTTEATLSDDER